MIRLVITRLVTLVPMMFLISSVVFFMVRFVPGDPARIMVGGQHITQANLDAIRKQYRLDKPLLTQYGYWVRDLGHGNLGRSFRQRKEVRDLIFSRMAVTIKLAMFAFLISLLISLPLGILAAVKRNTWIDVVASVFSLIGASSPVFLTSILMILLFSYKLNWLPALGRGNGPFDQFKHLIMPATALGFAVASVSTRITRSSMIEALTQDYIETARAKGLSMRAVVLKHAFRNALVPVITVAGLQFGSLLVGTVLVDYVFGLGGLGGLLIDAVQRRDYPVVQGMTIFIAALFILINLLVDVLYGIVDPRVRYGGR